MENFIPQEMFNNASIGYRSLRSRNTGRVFWRLYCLLSVCHSYAKHRLYKYRF